MWNLRPRSWIQIALVASWAVFSTGTPAVAAGYWFSPNGCAYGVEFPDKPQIETIIVPESGEVPEAQLADNRGLMRANCISLPEIKPTRMLPYYNDRQLLLSTLQSYVQQNGIINTSYSHKNTDIGVRASARGVKQIDGRWFTYEFIWYVSPRSVMSLTIGHFSEKYPTAELTSFLNSVSKSGQDETIPPDQSSFVTAQLPFDVSIDVPRDWWTLNETMNRLIRTSRDAVLDLRGISVENDEEIVLIAANSWPPSTYAALRVTRNRPSRGSPEEVRQISHRDLTEMRDVFETEMRQSLPIQGLKYVKTLDIQVEEIGGWPAIVFSYLRSGPKGPVIVYLIQITRTSDYLSVNLSYRQNEKAIWMPVIARIKKSIWAR